ncbi:MAG: metallophosphoesterase family protein [Candidatus Heimdallarchaeota archaeon]
MVVLKILGLSDLHSSGDLDVSSLSKIVEKEQIDLIIVSGDLTTFGTKSIVKNVLVKLNQINKPVFYIPGNMDSRNSSDFTFENITPLHGRVINYLGFNFLGLGASNPTSFMTPYELSEEELKEILDQALNELSSADPLIFISHTPPLNSEADIIRNGKHVGSSVVRAFVEKEKPVVILCGHIHESKSIAKIADTLCINPGAARHRDATIIEIEKDSKGNAQANGRLITF